MWTVCLLVVLPLVAGLAGTAGLPRPGPGHALSLHALAIPQGRDKDHQSAAQSISEDEDDPPGNKRSLTGAQDYPDSDYSSPSRFDEYPIVVPRAVKRTAVMVDRLFGMLKNAVNGDVAADVRAIAPDDRMDLQRRGQQKGRVYWRCYFNAVTCFRRRK